MIARPSRWLALVLAVVVALWDVTALAHAQATFTPAQTAISSTRHTVAQRVVLLQTTAPLTGLCFVALDIPDATGEQILPAGAI